MSIRVCERCAAATRQGKGQQCKNSTCITSEFCTAHTKSLFDLSLKPSSIPRAGTGLFTMKAIPKNQKIARYTGKVITQAKYDEKPSGYGVAIDAPPDHVMDAASTQSGLARYANDCRSANKRAGQCKGNNSKFDMTTTRAGKTTIWLRATKNIKAGSEILISYGRKYWGD